jgi:hypothetical protein
MSRLRTVAWPAWPRVWNGGPAEPIGAPHLVATFEAPTKSEANERSFWGANNRKKRQDTALDGAIEAAGPLPDVGPWCVRFTRIAPKALDDDNLASAFKRLRDRLCLMLRIDDRSPAVAFALRQEKGAEMRVRVEVWGGSARQLLIPGTEV